MKNNENEDKSAEEKKKVEIPTKPLVLPKRLPLVMLPISPDDSKEADLSSGSKESEEEKDEKLENDKAEQDKIKPITDGRDTENLGPEEQSSVDNPPNQEISEEMPIYIARSGLPVRRKLNFDNL